VVDSSPTSEFVRMAICRAEPEKEEEGGRHTGASESGEATEGLVNLGKQADKPGSSAEETLADLLKKLSDSYQPKKNITPKATTSGTARANKKWKVSPSETSDIPLPRGRTTRSKLKQSEKELQRALEESKKKRVDKGKEKVVEPVELDEMDLVDQSEKVAKVEVQTLKPKKAKTSSVSKSDEPSILAKRTRSAVKAKQVKITEEDDWSGEEEDVSDGEKDKLTKFGKRTILKGRLLKDLEEEGMILLLEKLEIQGWKDMVLQLDGRLARNEIVEFMANAEVKEGRVTSLVKGVQISFDAKELGEILGIPSEGYDDYTRQKWPSLDSLPTALAITRKFCDNEEESEPKEVYKSEMKPPHKVIFEFINKCVLPRQKRRHIANYMDLVLMECMDSGRQINWPGFIIQLLDRVVNGSKAHAIPYGFILTSVLAHYKVPLKKAEMATSKDHFGINTLLACDYEIHVVPNEPGSSKRTHINNKVRALVQESGAKDAEIARLKTRLAEVESERDVLRVELTKEREKNEGILHDMLNLLQAKTQAPSSSKP